MTATQRAEMAERDRRAERLALAKETSSTTAEIEWMQRIVDFQNETTDPIEFLEALKLDLEEDEVYVFTPKGKVIALTANATPVDFAYAIHTEVGHRCIGAKVNGRLVPLDTRLNSADTVEIFTSKAPTAGPSRDWLGMVASSRARTKIRQWFSRERREDAIEFGREELVEELRREGLPVQRLASERALAEVAAAMNYADVDALHAAIGDNRVSARAVAQRILRDLRGGVLEEQLPVTARQQPTAPRPGRGSAVGVYVEGLDDLMVRLSRCCTPVPGDEIVGFVTRGRGVSVHRADCANAASLASRSRERLIEVEWDHRSSGVFVATIEVVAIDRSRLLADVTKVVSEHHLNIVSRQHPDRLGPDQPDALRRGAGRSRPSRVGPQFHPPPRCGLRRLPHPPRQEGLTPSCPTNPWRHAPRVAPTTSSPRNRPAGRPSWPGSPPRSRRPATGWPTRRCSRT